MKTFLCLLVMVSLVIPIPAYAVNSDPQSRTSPDFSYQVGSTDMQVASLETDFIPVERKLIDDDKKKDEALKQKKGSSWWKWALAILIVGGAAAAAGSGGGGGNSGGSSNGTMTVSW